MARTFDAVIVGAGIVGASLAYHLAERGARVAVLEAAPAPATGATAKSAGGIRLQFSNPQNAALSAESLKLLKAFPETIGVDAGYRPRGYLFLHPASSWPAWSEAMRRLRALGYPVELLPLEKAREVVAFDSECLVGASFGPEDGVFDPPTVALAYLKAAREKGAELFTESPLLKAKKRVETWRIETPKETFEAPLWVNAAGAWSARVAERAGYRLPVEPYRRSVYLTAPAGARPGPLVVDAGSGVYFRPEGPRYLFGASHPDQPPGFFEGVDWEWFEEVALLMSQRFPWFSSLGLDLKSAWWGYYAETPDKNAVLGPVPGLSGAWVATGFSGHGAQHAPAVGRRLAGWMLEGQEGGLAAFSLSRFDKGARVFEAGIV